MNLTILSDCLTLLHVILYMKCMRLWLHLVLLMQIAVLACKLVMKRNF